MKRFFLDFNSYHKRERNGVFILLAIVVSLILYLNFSYLLFPPAKTNFNLFEQQIKTFTDSLRQDIDTIRKVKHSYPSEKADKSIITKGERFYFNPNNLSENDWKRLGLTDKQIQVIKHYEEKGGKFHTKEDVKKMYCIKEDLYVSLEPYILIPEIKKDSIHHQFAKRDTAKAEIIFVELNSADSLTLIKIRGIKGFYANKIIEHRKELGGYYAKEQLMEIWKFDKEKYDGMEKYVTVNSSLIKKININTATAKDMKHPYLNWKIVNGIISYRAKHGKFIKVEDILKTNLVDDETYRKIVPYLIVD